MRSSLVLFASLGASLVWLLPVGTTVAQTPSAAADTALDGLPVTTTAPHGDAGVRARLDAMGLGHEVDDEGNFRIVVAWRQENRSQLVFIAGQANPIGDSMVREVFSPAARVPAEGFSAEQANRLLRDSQDNVLGAWEIAGDVLLYVIKLHDDADGARLQDAIDMAAQIADDMEILLTDGGDEL